MNYFFQVLIDFQIYLLLATSLNLLICSGLLQVSHAAFFGLGAYTAALCSLRLGLGFVPATILAVVLTGVSSLLISLPTLRLRRDAFIMMALAVQASVYALIYNATGLTGGSIGLSGIPKPSIAGVTFSTDGEIAGLYAVVLCICLAGIRRLMKSPFGYALTALRDDEAAAQSLGVPVRRRKIEVTLVASAFAGVAGSLYAHQANALDPTSFTLETSILIVSICAVGGVGNIAGPMAGVALLLGVQEVLRFTFQVSVASNIRLLVFGLLVIWVALMRPTGLIGHISSD
jgi:branched-chain amino acid transport system permease protein